MWLFCYSVTLLCCVTLGTTFPDVCISVWVLWCPILNSGANVLNPHSAARLKTFEGDTKCQTLKMTRTLRKIAVVFLIYGKTIKKKKKGQKVLNCFPTLRGMCPLVKVIYAVSPGPLPPSPSTSVM